MKRSIKACTLVIAVFSSYCEAKKVTVPAATYYESQLPLHHPVKVIASDLDKVIVKRVHLFHIKPIASTIALYNSLDIPVVVWTNNSLSSYTSKIKKVDTKKMPFKPKGAFVVEKGRKKGPEDNWYSRTKKPSHTYYINAYNYTRNTLKLNNTDTVVFIDDLPENVNAARAVAKLYNLPIIAIQYTTAEQLQHDLDLFIGKATPSRGLWNQSLGV